MSEPDEQETSPADSTESVSTFTQATASATPGPSVTVSVKDNSEALSTIDKLDRFLQSRLHGPWTPEFLSEAQRLLAELRNLL